MSFAGADRRTVREPGIDEGMSRPPIDFVLDYSTITLFARFLGLSIARPSSFATQYETSWGWTFASTDLASAPVEGIHNTSSPYSAASLSPSVTTTTGTPRDSTSRTFAIVFRALRHLR